MVRLDEVGARLVPCTLCPPAHPVIDQHQRHHRLAHRHKSREQAGIVPALGDNFGRLTSARHGFLRLREAAGGLDGDSADDRLPTADAAEHAAVAVGFGADVTPPHPRPGAQGHSPEGRGGKRDERIVILAAAGGGHAEAGTAFKGENRRQGQKSFGNIRFEFIEHGLAEAGWHAGRHQLTDAADGILVFADLFD